jgi:hypothetical protein
MRFLSLLFLGLLAALPVRAEPTTLMTALDLMPAEEAWWGESRLVGIVDIAALKEVSGVREDVSFADFAQHKLGEDDELAVTSLLWRLHADVSFREYLLASAEIWPARLGFEFLDLDWASEIGNPPRRLLYLAGTGVLQGESLNLLADWGLAPVERDGTTVWVRGESDYGQDLKNRDPGFPFWGWLGSSVRLYRTDAALVAARSWTDLDLALAVERGTAQSLADVPRFRLAAEVAAHPDYSQGAVLQMTFVDQRLGQGGVGPTPEGLPPYDLLAFADREDASGHQLVLVLSYGTDAQTAAAAAAALPEKLAAYRDKAGKSLAERFPGLAVTATALETENGAAAVAVLSIPTLPVKVEGKVANRSLLYAQFLRMLWSRDLGFLAPRG